MPTMYMPDLEEGQLLRFSVETPATAALAPARRLPAGLAPRLTSRLAVHAAAATGGYTTNGWDTVYVIALPDVNAAIVSQKSSPTSWTATIKGGTFNPTIDGTGAFGDWALTVGGSGSIVRMNIPFTATVVVHDGDNTTFHVEGGTAFVEVKLEYIPQPPTDGTTPNNLKVRDSGGSQNDPVVTVSSVSYTSPAQDDGLDNALVELLQQWMNANLMQFEHVFATVNLGLDEASGDFAWLSPTTTSYAYLDNVIIADALLGVLCMTEGRSAEDAVQEIGSGAIPSGARSSFNLSLERVMTKMVMPGLPMEFTHAPAGTFSLSADATQITATQSFNLDAVKVGAIDYTPNVTAYSITVVDDVIETTIAVHTPISPGIDAYFSGTYFSNITLATKDDGTQSLTWTQAEDPQTNSWYTVATWVVITEAIASLILAVIGAIAGGVAASVESTVVKVLIGMLVGGVVAAIATVLSQIPNWIAGSVPGPAPSVSGLVDGATQPQKWADSADFKITVAVLNGGLQLGGNPFGS
jgi:hypothetical protein